MTDARSTHIPEVSGDVVAVTGSLVIDTQLREVQSFSVTLASQASATEAIVNGVLGDIAPGGTQKLTLEVFAADGATPGASAVNVAWLAVGK
jgi:hypothetical protein